MSHVLCKQRVVWDHTQLGGSGRGIRASKEEGGQEGEQSGDGAMSWSQRDDSEEGRGSQQATRQQRGQAGAR